MINNINPYVESTFRNTFQSTEIFQKIKHDFDENHLIWDKFFLLNDSIRPQFLSESDTLRHMFSNYCSMTVFHYLLPLLEKDYDTIYDIGCGRNMFKRYLPRLIGVGAEILYVVDNYNNVKDPNWPDIFSLEDFENLPADVKEECINLHGVNFAQLFADNTFHGDIHGFVNDEYVSKHQNYFQSVFSICALHYHPLSKFKKIITDFVSMISPGGRGFLSLNLQRMIDLTSENFLQTKFSTTTPSTAQYDNFLRTELATCNLKFLILDIDLASMNDTLNGNIRLVIDK